ncbi:hypothetical protein Tco_1136262 [Tanacetum coccineum]
MVVSALHGWNMSLVVTLDKCKTSFGYPQLIDKFNKSIRSWRRRESPVAVDWCDLKSISECVLIEIKPLLVQLTLVAPSFTVKTNGIPELLNIDSRIREANPLLILIILKTFECLRLHALHAKPRENEFESFSGQSLSKYIRQLILGPHEIQLNHSLFHLFSDEMMSDVDVFRPGVLDVVAAESYGTLVVTIQRDVIVCKAIIR